MVEKKPNMNPLGPKWWHHYGMKMKLVECTENSIEIEGSAAWLGIIKAKYEKGWIANWRINHGAHVSEVSGAAWFSDDDLRRAFALRDDIPKFGDWLIKQYGGTTASQGCFIRYRNFLNIPCPGTGHDGDPNISLELSPETQEAVSKIMSNVQNILSA